MHPKVGTKMVDAFIFLKKAFSLQAVPLQARITGYEVVVISDVDYGQC